MDSADRGLAIRPVRPAPVWGTLSAMDAPPRRSRVDVIVVAYNSAGTLRRCVEPLAGAPGIRVVIVDNASPDDGLATVADLPVTIVHADGNGGFSTGCNLGTAEGDGPYVLLLNPDAAIEPGDVELLADVLDAEPRTALVAPKLLESDGSVAPSQRRFPRLRSAWGQALLLHRVVPALDELVRDPRAYDIAGTPEWVSGACMLVRRTALEALGGLDEDFFLYCEDTDLCRRLRLAGGDVRYEPRSCAQHVGGVSGSRSALRPVLASSRARYARKWRRRPAAALEIAAIAVGEIVHAIATANRRERRRGHIAALRALARGAGASV
jgi:N-acetylglucosaminyl-diphospho-decaprenol L-rhamnosyltransferase